ncbi:hypothetical protein QF049_005350 [Paenibacillus sp. W4I10]|uniref:DUF2304 domain-containing protein n=1 Tax=Paenibacillus sp. W4I10 TaxID=3042298 RepID=UPI00278B2B2E|nr:DUF2304 domain-containing protein [Paenibacillus sp. W4I10]MDQ0724089.1 hypothetical protein [Paenibacillus sp. W4I10]
MISFKLQIILFVGAIISLFLVINLIKRYKLELKYSILWLLTSVVVLILSIFPKSVVFLAEMMGIELPVNALFLLTLLGIIIIMFSLTLEVSKSTTKIKELSQELGILKNDFEKLRDRNL